MEFLYWIYVSGVLFCSFVCPFISFHTNVTRHSYKNDAIMFRKCLFYQVVL